MNKIDELILEVRRELAADFISTDIVGMDGISIGGGSVDPNFNATEASARFSVVMKLAMKVSTKINTGKVDENLVTTDKAYILTRFLGDGSYYWGIAVTRNATLGTVRLLMNEYVPKFWDAIPS
jgi:predicted regulator of Ras-like GTPase activity (Roadblock/LC7/MglB family)